MNVKFVEGLKDEGSLELIMSFSCITHNNLLLLLWGGGGGWRVLHFFLERINNVLLFIFARGSRRSCGSGTPASGLKDCVRTSTTSLMRSCGPTLPCPMSLKASSRYNPALPMTSLLRICLLLLPTLLTGMHGCVSHCSVHTLCFLLFLVRRDFATYAASLAKAHQVQGQSESVVAIRILQALIDSLKFVVYQGLKHANSHFRF